MNTNLFGQPIINEESFEIIYKGSSFTDGKILIRPLYLELQSLESVLKDSIDILIKNGKLDQSCKDFQIFIEIDKGSIWERVKISFANKKTVAIIGALVIPFLNTTYSHFLNGVSNNSKNEFYQEILEIEKNAKYKNNLKNILSPLNNNDDNLMINYGTVNLNINYSQKEKIIDNLNKEVTEDSELLKNGEFREELNGIIRKLDLDASQANYFGFTIDNGPSRIPTGIKGEFNLNDYKNIINEHIQIDAMVKYKDNEIKNIEILKYKFLGKQERLTL